MPTPLPGMDPYLEHPSLWPDVHNTMAVALRTELVSVLRPRYAVLLEERSYLSEPDGLVLVGRPDSAGAPVRAAGRTPEVTVEVPVPDRIREIWLEVRLPATSEVVTVVEFLSPTNKRPGSEGRRLYEDRRCAILGTRTHLVEIDLCRSGEPVPLVGPQPAAEYRILVSRGDRRPRAELMPFGVRDAIPGFRLPLRTADEEPLVDLGSLLRRVYEDSGYELAIDYRLQPVPPLPADLRPWLDGLLQRAGRR